MRDKHGDQYDDDDPIIESQARPIGETSGGTPLLGHINDMPLALKRIGELEAENAKLREQLLMAASALDAGKDGCQFVRVMDDNGKFICMAEIHRGANQSVVPLLEMSARVGVRLTLGGQVNG